MQTSPPNTGTPVRGDCRPTFILRLRAVPLGLAALLVSWAASIATAADDPLAWPAVPIEAKPHAYWWWMGSAVDTNNLTKELTRYRDAGLGGVHIIPIYGAKGWESNYLSYLSPQWMAMLDYTVREAKRLGLEVDMTTGTGWCFGGPQVTDQEANAVLVSRQWSMAGGAKLPVTIDRAGTQALMAFGPDGQKVDLLMQIAADGSVSWTAPEGNWSVYALAQKPGAQKVKRAAPGGAGWMLNLAYPQAMSNYLRWMDQGLAGYRGLKPRAQYHDSYEYKMDWSPVLLAEFEKRRGYRLADHLDAFLTGQPADRAARVKCDYRETISDIMAEETLPMWVKWSHANGFITRNEAHGSPGNWLDLYAAADIPETEMFHKDRNILISKFASSAAHVTGKKLVAAETGTWLKEHFTETLADLKYLLDDLFLSGVNHIFYHGACYSPDEAPWPGWVFYASYEMNPRNSVWRDVDALNAYATRVQSVLQAGQPDNDLLLYWPLHDFWSNPEGMVRNLTVHARDWFEAQPVGRVAKELWEQGYGFDYVSDRQLQSATVASGKIQTPGGSYRAIVVPECRFISPATFAQLAGLANRGATVIFENELPTDVAGAENLAARQAEFRVITEKLRAALKKRVVERNYGSGRVLCGSLSANLAKAKVPRESMVDDGLSFLRRAGKTGSTYFIANRTGTNFVGWIAPTRSGVAAVVLDPVTGRTGLAGRSKAGEYHLELAAGEAVLLRVLAAVPLKTPPFPRWQPAGEAVGLTGTWQVRFLNGGPELPVNFTTTRLVSWTEQDDAKAQSFAGTAVYSVRFDAPGFAEAQRFQLDLGRVCQSARVRMNGRDYGTLFAPPFRVVVDNLKPTGNVLEVRVTNTSANRIRDLDRRGVVWQNFHDINFVNINYQKFDASDWALTDSGLLGPVTLTPVKPGTPPVKR
jgi:hypothetical protein